MRIDIEVVKHEHQRYNTLGDWEFDQDLKGDVLRINISDTGNKDYNYLIGLHEMIEAYLCYKEGISSHEVDKWDKDHIYDVDPGGITRSPYYKQHTIATIIEQIMAGQLEVNWDEYEETLSKLWGTRNGSGH